MIRFAALNYSSSEEDSQDAQERAATKEAEESEAFMLYNRALSLQRQGSNDKAEEAFRELLDHPFITEALELLGDATEGSNHPALQLLYSIHKNIANMALQRKDYKAAIMSYIEAVKIDTTEVTVWYKIGTIAKQIYNFPLARMGFEVGLQCNPHHWPCLDNVITLLYAMNDYWYCLYYISRALLKDHGYTKGLVLRKQIFKEDPSLRDTTANMFKECDPVIDKVDIDQDERDEFINESLQLAEERRKLIKPRQLDMTQLPIPIRNYSWCAFGESLLALYKMLKSSDPPKSMASRVDLSAYNGEKTADDQPMETDVATATEGMMVDDVEAAVEQLDAKTVTSLEQILSGLPADQMTELLQSTPPTPVKVTSSVESHVTCTVSPMETCDSVPVDGIPIDHTLKEDKEETKTDTVSDKPLQETINPDVSKTYVIPTDAPSQETAPSEAVQKEALAAVQEKAPSDLAQKVISPVDPVVRELFSPESISKSKGAKRKKGGGFIEDYGGKRRSARVRNTSKRKEEDCINFQELLLSFLPSNLREYDEDTSAASIQQTEHLSPHKQTEAEPVKGDSLCTTEEEDVKTLLLGMQRNGGCIDLMMQFVFRLAEKSHYKWPVGLNRIYIKMYKSVREHFDLPDTCSDDEIDDNLIELGQTLLLNAELQLDQWTVTRSKFITSPIKSQNQGSTHLKESDLPTHYYDDEYFIIGMMSRRDVFGDAWSEYCCRVYWMKARFYMLQGKMEDAVFCFKKTLEYLQAATTEDSEEKVQIFLPTCSVHNVLSIESVERQLKSLERSQSFDVTQKLYDAGEYEKVVECLLKTSLSQVSMTTSATERRSQLLLLQESLIKLKDYKRAFLWSEITLDEAVHTHKSSSSDKDQWAETLVQTCESLNLILKNDRSALSDLPMVNQARLSQNLIYIIDISMSVPDSCIDMPINTVLPWILLYKLIEKDESRSPKPDSMETAEEFDSSIPPSIMLLNIAHEYLGRHAWCTKSEGELLLFTIKILSSEKHPSDIYNEEMGQAVEQCFFCLYGHPTKKGRYRHLMDHNAPQIELTWERAEEIFEYFKPKLLPEFDSYKTEAVPGEVEHLLRRICNLVPESQKPIYVIDSLQDYIDGTTETFDEESIYNPSQISKELYYLLADYYFKNHELAKAVKYYLNDICVNPSRFDSWAGMALAKMSQLEQKLNSTELKMDFPVHKKSIAALRCFRRALQIEEYNGKLWMEYGSLAYQLHSHSSRQLKWKYSFPLTPENEQIATDCRQEMLQTSYNCYRKAIECENEEAWLQHYMIGKCLEKMKKSPDLYLKHYQEASRCLYEENAPYPKKIAYAYTTPHLAVEALEMFYRLHTSILKLLLNDPDPTTDYQNLERFVNLAATSPFALGKQKNEDTLDSIASTMETPKQSQQSTSSQQDHTYSKRKEKKSLLQSTDPVSLENSSQSFSDSQSQESNFMSSRQVSQSEDVSLTSADSFSQPMEIDDTESSMASRSQADINLISSESQSNISQSQSRTFELSANDMQEEVSKVKELDLSKPTHIDFIKKYNKDCDSLSSIGSSDLFEDEEGNITVTAKLEVIGRSSSSESDSRGQVPFTSNKNDEMPRIEPRKSFGFEPMLTDEKDRPQPSADVGKESNDGESSQDIKDNVSQAINSVMDVVETTENILSSVEKELATTIKSEESTMQTDTAVNKDSLSVKEVESSNSDFIKSEIKEENQLEIENLHKGDNSKEVSMATEHSSTDLSQPEIKIEPSALKNTSLGSICLYDSTSSEDEEINEKKSQKAEGHGLSANLSLCADYESLSSESEGKASEESDKTEKNSGKQEVVRTMGTSFDDLTHNPNVNVLEISVSGISGDVSEKDNKIKPQDSNPVNKNSADKMDVDGSADTEVKQEISKDQLEESVSTTEKDNEIRNSDGPNKEEPSNPQQSQNSKSNSTQDPEIKLDIQNNQMAGQSSSNETMEKQSAETAGKDMMVTQNKVDPEVTDQTQTSAKTNSGETPSETAKYDQSKTTADDTEKMEVSDKTNTDDAASNAAGPEKEGSGEVTPSGKTGEELRKLLIEKCMAALHLCLSRFPTHYKCIYRLADVYMNSPFHKNLKFCQDLLLGLPNWQQHSHMPAQGLFGEKKQNNFFQGIWRIPIGDIDRSGSFASHMNKAVLLLMDVLKERKELTLMYQIHLWLNRSPESGKKYLRDSERMLFVKMSYRLCWEIIDDRNKELSKMSDKERLEKILMEVYKIWNYGNSSKMKNDIGMDTNQIFGETFDAAMKERMFSERPLFKQAVDFCQHYNQMKLQMQKAGQDPQGSGNKNETSLFSPTRSPFTSFSPTPHQPTTVLPNVNLQKWTASPQLPQQQSNSAPVSSAERSKAVPSPSVSMATLSSSSNKFPSPMVSTTKSSDVMKISQPQVVVKKLPSNKISSPVVQQKDPKPVFLKDPKPFQRKPAVNPFAEKQVLVEQINPESIFETLLASEFGRGGEKQDSTVKSQDETDGSTKSYLHGSKEPATKKQTIVVSKSSTDPIICKVRDAIKGGLNIVSPEFGNLEVISPNTPCPDTMKFTIPSKDPNAKTKTTIVITKKKPPIKITDPIEISSSDDEEEKKTPQQSSSVQESSAQMKKLQTSSSNFQKSFLSAVGNQTKTSQPSNQTQKIFKSSEPIKKSVINLEEIMDSAEDSIPSSSASGSVYVPDESSSDSIPSSPEPQNCRLDEVTGLFIPSDVKFFNEKNTLLDDDK